MVSALDFEKSKQYQLLRALKTKVYSNATLFPISRGKGYEYRNKLFGGLQKEDGQFSDFAKTKRIHPDGTYFKEWHSDYYEDDLTKIKREYLDEEVIFIGSIPNHYGHFITEGLSRLWPLIDDLTEKKVVYISESEVAFEDFFRLFGLVGQRVKRIISPTCFKSIIVPEASIRLHDYYHPFYSKTIEAILKKVPSSKSSCIFLSKEKNSLNGKSIGEKHIKEVLIKNKFEIIYPELLSIEEFLSKMFSASKVIALSASSAHNAIFMKKNTELICLNRSDHHHPLQTMINEIRDLKVSYVDVSFNIFRPNFSNGPYNIIVSRYFRKFLKKNYYQIPSRILITIWTLKSTVLYLAYFLFLQTIILNLSRLKGKFRSRFVSNQ